MLCPSWQFVKSSQSFVKHPWLWDHRTHNTLHIHPTAQHLFWAFWQQIAWLCNSETISFTSIQIDESTAHRHLKSPQSPSSISLCLVFQGHGQGQAWCTHLRPWGYLICLLFIALQLDHLLLRCNEFLIWPWKSKVKVIAQGQIMGSTWWQPPIDSHPMLINPSIPEIQPFQHLTLKIQG